MGFCTSLMIQQCPLKSVIAGHMMNLVVVGVHVLVVVLVVVVVTLGAVSADASHDGLLDLGPLATDVAWLVVVASASSRGDWVWVHFECFAIFLVGPVGATERCLVMVRNSQKYSREIESDLTVVDLGLLPAEEFVGDVVLLADVLALLLLVAEGVSISDGVWLPLVGGLLV